MWYGIYKGLEAIDSETDLNNHLLVSFRYDYFNIPQSKNINEMQIIDFIYNNLNTNNIQFFQYLEFGTDNLYIGKYFKIKTLISKFNFELDDILNNFKHIKHPELLVNFIAKDI